MRITPSNRIFSEPRLEALEQRRLLSGGVSAVVTQHNLVSDGFVAADNTDPDLKNPWGVAFGPGGPL